jgi:outer membrane protein assembly complex protein YaeT
MWIKKKLPLLLCLALAAGGFPVSTPLAAREPVSITGLQSITPDQARKWISSPLESINSGGVTMARADDLAFFLENAMREQGYKGAAVDWEVEGEGTEARIVLTVSEGDSLMVGDIAVTGNDALETPAVIELITSTTRKRLGKKPGEAIPFVARDVQQGKAKVVAFYKLLGFRHVTVEIASVFSANRANLAVTVTEGSSGEVGEIEFPDPPNPVIVEEYTKIRSEFVGKTFTGAIPANLASRIRAAAVDAGYFYAEVTAEETTAEMVDGRERVNMTVDATWGEPVAISGLRVSGNEKVNTSFFDRHFDKLLEGPYSPEETNKTVEELLQSGAFETVRTDVVAQEDGSYLLDINVEEGDSRTLGVYGGFTNYEGAIAGFEFRNLNLLGSVRRIDSAIEFSMRGARGEIEYIDPWFLGSGYQMRSGLFAINREEEGYEKFKTGGRYEMSKRFGRQMQDSIALFGEAAYTDVHEADIDPIYLGERHYLSHHLGISFTHDRRDDPRKPRKGYIAQTSISAASSAIGSEVEFLKATGRLGYYLPHGQNTLRIGAKSGLISPTGGTDAIPIDLRFFAGGSQSVRSFQERSLGFRDPLSGDPIGGNFYTLFNFEYEMPVRQFEGLSFVPFADAGNLIIDDADAGLTDMRYAVGLGMRYQTPIGPLRLEYGYNPDQRPGEPQGTFHIGFGFSY